MRLIDFSAESIEGSSQQKSIRFKASPPSNTLSSYDGVQKILDTSIGNGNYVLQITATDSSNNKSYYRLPVFEYENYEGDGGISLKNNDFEGKLPSIDLSFDKTELTFDTQAPENIIEVTYTISDESGVYSDPFGINYAGFELVSPVDGHRVSPKYIGPGTNYEIVEETETSITIRMEFDFKSTDKQGTYNFKPGWVIDNNGNGIYEPVLNNAIVFNNDQAPEYTVPSFEIIDYPESVDVSDGPVDVIITYKVSDPNGLNSSGSFPELWVENPCGDATTNQKFGEGSKPRLGSVESISAFNQTQEQTTTSQTYDGSNVIEEIIEYKITFTKNTMAGKWSLDLDDGNRRNGQNLSNKDLQSNGYLPDLITVINSNINNEPTPVPATYNPTIPWPNVDDAEFDLYCPVISDIEIDKNSVDVSDDTEDVKIRFRARDNKGLNMDEFDLYMFISGHDQRNIEQGTIAAALRTWGNQDSHEYLNHDLRTNFRR